MGANDDLHAGLGGSALLERRYVDRLVKGFTVAKPAILVVVRKNNLVGRRQPFSITQKGGAKRPRESGRSLSVVGEQMQVDQEAMPVTIIKVEVQLRPPSGSYWC